MSRALSMHRTVVVPGERARFLARAKAREAHYTASGCNFWLFEEEGLAGAFIEFVEAPDSDTLKSAHAAATDSPLGAARIYSAVALS